MLKKVYDSI